MFFSRKKQESFAGVWLTAAIVFVVKCLYIALTTVRGLATTSWLIDDSFIEMRVARNIALGKGFSFDGLHPTTGAPFLWTELTSITHMIFDKDWAIRATIIISTLSGALAALVVFFLALKLTQKKNVAWTAFLLATFTGNAFFSAMNGMETSFFTLFVLLGIATYLGVGRPKKWGNFAWGAVVGLCTGIAMMTRGDGLFVMVSLLILWAWQWFWMNKNERKAHWKLLVGMLVTAGLCFGFFMGWQLMLTGSPLPANQVGRRELALAFHNFSFSHFSLPRYLLITGWNVFQLQDLISLSIGSALLALVAFVSGSLQKPLRNLSIITLVDLGIFYSLLVGYQWYFADFHGLRYILPGIHILCIYVALLLWQLPIEHHKRTAVVFLTLCLLGLAEYKHYQLTTHLDWATDMSYVSRPTQEQETKYWSAIDWMTKNIPKGTVVGVRDYGRVALFTDLPIQDLAGNIDPLAAYALKNGTLKDYLKSRNVKYLYIPSLEQRQDALYRYIHANMKLQLVKEAPKGTGANLYRIL